MRSDSSGALTLADGAYFVACALSYSFALETRNETALSFVSSADDGQPLTDYAFSLALLWLR